MTNWLEGEIVMIQIALCDDEHDALYRMYRYITEYSMIYPQYDIEVQAFSNPLDLLKTVKDKKSFDIFLLDIFMKPMLGTKLARKLRSSGEEGEIIFITTSREHAIDAFEVEAVQYLIKPYKKRSLFNTLDKVMLRVKDKESNFISLKTAHGFMRLYTKNVVFTEAGKNNYQLINTIHGESIEVRMSAAQLYKLLNTKNDFSSCGASINVNLKYVRQISKDKISFDTGHEVYYPYRLRKKLKEDFLSYQMNGRKE